MYSYNKPIPIGMSLYLLAVPLFTILEKKFNIIYIFVIPPIGVQVRRKPMNECKDRMRWQVNTCKVIELN